MSDDRQQLHQVRLYHADELRWADNLGQDDIEAWCEANGLPIGDVAAGSVVLTTWSDGTTTIEAEILERDDDGAPFMVGEDDDAIVSTLRVEVPLVRPLPEGYGTVLEP